MGGSVSEHEADIFSGGGQCTVLRRNDVKNRLIEGVTLSWFGRLWERYKCYLGFIWGLKGNFLNKNAATLWNSNWIQNI